MSEGVFGHWIGVLKLIKGLAVISVVRYLSSFLLLCPSLSQLLEGSLCVWVNFEDFTYIWRLMIDAHKQAYIF